MSSLLLHKDRVFNASFELTVVSIVVMTVIKFVIPSILVFMVLVVVAGRMVSLNIKKKYNFVPTFHKFCDLFVL